MIEAVSLGAWNGEARDAPNGTEDIVELAEEQPTQACYVIVIPINLR